MSAEHEYWLNENFKQAFALPEDARDWLLSLWNAIQVFDDMADGDFPDRDKLDAAICDTLVNMPANPFFRRYSHALLPIMAVAILKWQGSDEAERTNVADARSYMWRAGFYDVVLAVVRLVHGDEVAKGCAIKVMHLYGEDFSAYIKEFAHA